MSYTVSETRTINYIKHIKASFVLKGLAVLLSFFIIPLLIDYLGSERYGIWSTFLSIISWIILLDIGIGNGLRNKITESLANDESKDKVKYYISTTYVVLGVASFLMALIFFSVSIFLPWQSVFNSTVLSNNEFIYFISILIVFLFLNFWLSIINQIFNGFQQASLVTFNQLLINIMTLIFVFILKEYFEASLILLGIFYGVSLITANLIMTIWFFRKNKSFAPKLCFYKNKYIKEIMSLGFKFFIIQISVIVIFTTDKILITQLFAPEYVTQYDIVFKLFSMITIIYGLIINPIWSAYSDAYCRNDFQWIRNSIKKQIKFFCMINIITILLIIIGQKIVFIWIGDSFKIDNTLFITMGCFILISTWNFIFASFINATNLLNYQIICSVIGMLINIPLSIILVKVYDFGVSAIVVGTILSLLPFAIIGPIQTYFILKKGENINENK